jgi:hypothetical protein
VSPTPITQPYTEILLCDKTMPEKRALSRFSCGLVDQMDLVVVPPSSSLIFS